MQRRQFIATSAALAAASTVSPFARASDATLPFKISLAEWSLHRMLRDEASGVTNLDFPRIAKEDLEIDAIEYVNQFFMDKARDKAYLTDLKTRCDDLGVTSVLIMVDREGNLGDPKEDRRMEAVENHRQWLEAAKFLGCHSIRVNASSRGNHLEQQKLAADGLRRLSEIAAPMDLNVIVENHGGWSSHGEWLAGTIKMVGLDNCGTLPDFGNFRITRGDNPIVYDRYLGVEQLMPMAKAVSAKSHSFNKQGDEKQTDFTRMMKIVLDHDYHGYVGIEYEGDEIGEIDGIKKTRDLLIRIRDEHNA